MQLHHQCPELVQEILQRLSLILLYVIEIVRDKRGSLVDDELFPK